MMMLRCHHTAITHAMIAIVCGPSRTAWPTAEPHRSLLMSMEIGAVVMMPLLRFEVLVFGMMPLTDVLVLVVKTLRRTVTVLLVMYTVRAVVWHVPLLSIMIFTLVHTRLEIAIFKPATVSIVMIRIMAGVMPLFSTIIVRREVTRALRSVPTPLAIGRHRNLTILRDRSLVRVFSALVPLVIPILIPLVSEPPVGTSRVVSRLEASVVVVTSWFLSIALHRPINDRRGIHTISGPHTRYNSLLR